MCKVNNVLAIVAIVAAASVQADTKTVNTKVTFVKAVTATVEQEIDFASIVKLDADGTCKMKVDNSLEGCTLATGTVQRGQVKVEGKEDEAVQIEIDTANNSDDGITFTPRMVNSTDTNTELEITGVEQTLTGGAQTFYLFGDLAITVAQVGEEPDLSVDFTVSYN